ncbi:DUF5050 domain-containing protein [Paenibacillus hexagrammi]|uniref:DUF5050 domain-containing protein n=1 Tax=Paenibacillus hexagrammi TaxID=2908839 RepID=A0ABY3SRX0_9BACL|nr:DUF5050 domain-containing protein [Paenibacillus sp. YPD9-1]UJF35901.1 DUF5050 domain-containing protein [Paenibacillus sp. YPD9-1]
MVYHDITYVPMTWYDSRLLGLEATWSAEHGLDIKQNQVASSYMHYQFEHHNGNTYTAEVPASEVTINGKVIDNTKEEYPLLSFRDVTYFPLTWRFAHDEFGWDYEWDHTNGLSISSNNTQVQSVDLPSYASENDVALYKGYYYFVETIDTTNHVYRAPVQHPSDKEEIYSYNAHTYEGLQKQITFQIRDNALWFTYHLGGNIMGHDEYVKISDDGKAELLHQGYLDFRDTPYGTLYINLGASAFEGGNLYLSNDSDGTNRKTIGEQKLMYGVVNGGAARDAASSLAVVGDDVYVIATGMNSSGSAASEIYRINLKTNKTEKIVNSSVTQFQIIGQKLYFVKYDDDLLYESALDGSGEVKVSDFAVSWFGGLGGQIFYTTKKEANQFELYQADTTGKDSLVWKTPVREVKVLQDKLVCRLSENDDYGAVFLDDSGKLLLKVADPVSQLLTSDDGILLTSSKDSSMKLIR